jgi:DtxR family Mn-dependent transcriptional regulator
MVDNGIFTESEEMYLVTVVRLVERGVQPPVPVSVLANELNISAISANQMVRKLEECDLVTYTPYKGVSLTDDGLVAALRVLRHRRLWEVFLVERLHLPLQEAEHQACRLEHALPPEAVDRLAEYLGNPQHSPQGLPIPSSGANTASAPDVILPHAPVGCEARVTHIQTDSPSKLFLAEQGIAPGARLTLLAVNTNGDMLVNPAGRTPLQLASSLAGCIHIQPIEPKKPQHANISSNPSPN